MRIVGFYHSILSDWNHGNAHFLRGVVTELQARGHDVTIYEPRDAWSVESLVRDHGEAALAATMRTFPGLRVVRYDEASLDLDRALDGADLVLVHEWNSHTLVRRVGAHARSTRHAAVLFHDTRHRSVSDASQMAAYDLSGYDGVLAFGEVIRARYLAQGWARRAWTWHEAADTRLFVPRAPGGPRRDLVWVGNWGDDERTAELREFLIEPVQALGLTADVHGVRYPEAGLSALADAGIAFRGWLANHRVPAAFAAHRVTVHVPRRPYVRTLPGIPTIRVFEALACGIPLISAPWDDAEGLFTPGDDFLVATTGAGMRQQLRDLLADRARRDALARHGLQTIRARHTCAHRVDELLAIAASLDVRQSRVGAPAGAATRRAVTA